MKNVYGLQGESLWTAFGFEWGDRPVISFVGGGGKSSLIQRLSEELSGKKIYHRIMTTTHMWPMVLKEYGQQTGPVDASGKVCPPTEPETEKIFEKKVPVLIEADGSRGLPCKAPEAWEPVIRPETTHVFGVMGASCLGMAVKDCCHRPERVMAVLGCGPDHRMQVEDLARLAKSPRGLYKNVTEKQKFGIIINQVDTEAVYQKIKPIEKLIQGKNIWFTCLRDNGWSDNYWI